MHMSGLIVLVASMVVTRILNEQGFRKLDADQKVRLMDGFSHARAYSLIPLLGLIGLFWLLMTQTEIDRQALTVSYFAALLLYVIVRTVLSQRKLRELEMPADYQQLFTLSQVVSLAGIAWFFFAMTYPA